MSAATKPDLNDPVAKIPFVGATQESRLKRLGIKTVYDLLNYAPRDLIDLSDPKTIQFAKENFSHKWPIQAQVLSCSLIKTPRKGMWLVSAKLTDGEDEIEAIWFNQPYLKKSLKIGQKYVFYGAVEYNFMSKSQALSNPQIFPEPILLPIYPLTEGMTSRQIIRFVKLALERGYKIEEFLPESILKKNNLMPMGQAVKELHLPSSKDDFQKAKHRFNFNNLLQFVLANLVLKKKNEKAKSYQIKIDNKATADFVNSLPYKLTEDQTKATHEILTDMEKSHPMNRLLQGDVGSGKTIVALIASLAAIRAGYRVAWLAPTEILARQHFQTAKKFLEKMGVSIGLLTGSMKNAVEADLLIGTHAFFYRKPPEKLALVVVDEQHRFGVEQRSLLKKNILYQPHFLSLSATPIPRSLAHIIFGNLDISVIREKPHGRLPVKTYLIPEVKRASSYGFIDKLIARGQQTFVICPLITPTAAGNSEEISMFDERAERKTVETEIKNLKKTVLGKRKTAALHGKIKPAEKEEIMAKMVSGKIDVLVSTSVVEVGVDIQNATTMIIEDAEHFGLSQLHQFRGRIGRSNLLSYCFLFSKNLESDKTKKRLKTFVQNSDGFKLAEMDLKSRGPGAILGLEQSGFKNFNPLWFENTELIDNASRAAHELIDKLDKFPVLRHKVLKQLETEHLE